MKVRSKTSYSVVTGASGFIGSHLTESLLRDGFSVIAVDNFDGFYSRADKERNLVALKNTARSSGAKFQFLEKDILKLDRRDFQGKTIDCVFHLAARAGVKDSISFPEQFATVNISGTVHLARLAKELACYNFVFASSSSVYGRNTPAPFCEDQASLEVLSPYAASKLGAEVFLRLVCQMEELKAASLRLFTVYGPRQRPDLAISRFTRALMADETIELYGAETSARDYTFVDDVVRAFRLASGWVDAQASGTCDCFNIGSSNPATLPQLISVIENEVGHQSKVKYSPQRWFDMVKTHADISKSREVLKFTPQYSLAEGIARYVQWVKAARPSDKQEAA